MNSISTLRVAPSLKRMALALLFLSTVLFVQATTITITTNTSWSAITGGTGGGQPTSADVINVTSGATLLVDVTNGVCASMSLGSLNSSNTAGTLAFNAATSKVTVSGSITLGPNGGQRTGSIDMTNGGTLTASSIVVTTLGTWKPGAGTVELTGNNTLPTNAAFATFYNLVTTGATTTSQALTINNDLTGAGSLTQASGNLITVKGNWNRTGGFSASTDGVTLSGTAKTITGNAGLTFTTLTVNGTYTNNQTGASSLTVSTALSGNGTLTQGVNGANLNIAGTSAITGLTANASGNTVTYNNGGTSQAIKAASYNNLTLSGASAKSVPAVTVGGNFSATGGNVTAGGIMAVSGNFSIGSSTIFNTGGFTHTVGGNWTNAGTVQGNGTINFNGSAAQDINTSNFTNISFTNTGVKTAKGPLTISGDVTIANNFTAGAYTHTVGGNWSQAGTFDATGSTINFNGGGAQSIGVSNFNNVTFSNNGIKTVTGLMKVLSNLTVTGTATLDLGANVADNTGSGGVLQVDNGAFLKISGGHKLPAGYTDPYQLKPTSTVEFYGTDNTVSSILARTYGNLKISGTTTLQATGVLNIVGDLNIGSGSTFNATNDGVNNAFTHTIQGNWTNNGTFTASTTTISFEGTGVQTISGGAGTSTTFNILKINNGTGGSVTIAQPVFVTNDLTLTKGIVTTPALASSTSASLLTINNAATATGASDASYVNGPITKVGYQPFIFPVGKAIAAASGGTSAKDYNPINISAPLNLNITTDATNAFTAEYFNKGAKTVSSAIKNPTIPAGLQQVSACQYWTLKNTVNAPTVDVTLNWKATSNCSSNPNGYITDPATVVVAHSSGTQWDSYGRDGGTTGNATAGSVKWLNVSNFSPFTIGTTNATLNPLPVTVVSFTGRKTDGGTQLTWTVAGESNIAGYEVERKGAGGQFVKIGFVTAAGNSSYTFNDPARQKGAVFYRLKNVDNDGRFGYSSILSFRNGVGILVFPTLVTGNATILHDAATAGALISLSTADGRQVKLQKPQTGATQTTVDMTGLQTGLYLLRWSDGSGHVETVKVIKQ